MSKEIITAITELDKSNYKTKVYSGGHFIYADEPEVLGGTDEGMTPGALLLASLGTCTAITVRMYADRKQIPLDEIKISLAICPEDEMDKSTTITRKIDLIGPLSDEDYKRLMIIADKCPIHKLLSNPIKIENAL
ncbi:MAG: OsmC family peroxiredoxin [Pedobacter sp.]|nr:MAG: OsmC family peroxiredoxin [Pedobacter sp.]